jgi:hypothetical protein
LRDFHAQNITIKGPLMSFSYGDLTFFPGVLTTIKTAWGYTAIDRE